jgi:hypothetical protein
MRPGYRSQLGTRLRSKRRPELATLFDARCVASYASRATSGRSDKAGLPVRLSGLPGATFRPV